MVMVSHSIRPKVGVRGSVRVRVRVGAQGSGGHSPIRIKFGSICCSLPFMVRLQIKN